MPIAGGAHTPKALGFFYLIMAKLGYTWYPKDWGNSDSVFELSLCERGLYREFIDLAMLNDNKTEIKKDVWTRKFSVSINELNLILDKLLLLNLIEIKENILFIPSCESRLKLVRGGSIGGKKSKPIPKPIVKQIEKEKEIEIEIKDIVSRKLKFSDSLKPFINVYPRETLNDFYKYWTEPNKSNTKFRQELEKTWDNKRRLENWTRNDKNFKKETEVITFKKPFV